jgi:hypothetical protein
MPTSENYAYLAGIIDGEGYFVAGRDTRTFGLRVSVIDECLINWLHQTFGGYKLRGGETVVGNKVHVWQLQKQEPLLTTLHGILPHLVIKRQQAEAMITLVEHLQAMPRYDRPSSTLSPAQRKAEGRREIRAEWTRRGDELRDAVRDARHVGVRKA